MIRTRRVVMTLISFTVLCLIFTMNFRTAADQKDITPLCHEPPSCPPDSGVAQEVLVKFQPFTTPAEIALLKQELDIDVDEGGRRDRRPQVPLAEQRHRFHGQQADGAADRHLRRTEPHSSVRRPA